MLADMAIGVETARLAMYRAAWEVDQVRMDPCLKSGLEAQLLCFLYCTFAFVLCRVRSSSIGICFVDFLAVHLTAV